MKKNGWELSAMLLVCLSMAFFLFIAVYIYNMHLKQTGLVNDHSSSETVSYTEMEKTVNSAFKKYVSDHYVAGSDDIVVTVTELQNNAYLGELDGGSGVKCNGYGKYYGTTKQYYSYVHCGLLYTTVGYDPTLE
jgi:hypothetical protein